jgi:rare lipoprotein A
MRRAFACAVLALAAALAGCADAPTQGATGGEAASRPASVPISQLLKRPPDYYTDDGPDGAPPVDLARVADATPRPEPPHPTANEPYNVFGRDYAPMKAPGDYKRQGTASWYGRKYNGQRTAGGEIYDMYAMSASHPTLPIPSYARVTNLANRASVVVRVNDRGPFASGRIMDVSYAAAYRLGFVQSGSAQVEVESILPPGHFAAAAPERPAPQAAAPEPEPPMPVSIGRNGIYLQLGAFSVSANAENFGARIARQLEPLGTEVSIVLSGTLSRVQLGPFKDRAAAQAAAERVRALVDVKPVLVVR